MPWDTLSPADQAKAADRGVAEQLRERVGPFSPFWRERLRTIGVSAASVTSVAALRRLPTVGERDICPDADPAGGARLVLQGDEEGFALHVPGEQLRTAMRRRLTGAPSYRRQVEAAIRPVTYTYGGLGLVLPIASTRDDLDVMARAGARLWSVLGLTAADVLVSCVPAEARIEHVGLTYAALGAGAPALFPGADIALAAETLRTVPATVLALPSRDAARVIDELTSFGPLPESIRTILLVGPPGERPAVATVEATRVLSVWGPADGRWLYGEARAGAGWITYPDLEVWDVVDPVTGEQAPVGSGGELVLTQLGVRGTALLRWRTGAMVDGPLSVSGPRTVPVIPPSLATDTLVLWFATSAGEVCLDRRVVCASLAAQGEPTDFSVALDRSGGITTNGSEAVVAVLSDHLGVPVRGDLSGKLRRGGT